MGYVEYVAALLLAAGVTWLLTSAGQLRRGPVEWLSGGLAHLVAGWRGDPWPRGVQEEDPDRPWGRPAPERRPQAVEPPPARPVLMPLRPEIRHR